MFLAVALITFVALYLLLIYQAPTNTRVIQQPTPPKPIAGPPVSTAPVNRTVELPPNSSIAVTLIFNLTNIERVKSGLPQLSYEPSLAAVATWHSECLVKNSIFAHDSAECGTVEGRFENFNISNPGGENLFRGGLGPTFYIETGEFTRYYTEGEIAKITVSGWMNSTAHRDNILSDKYTHMGIGFYDDGTNITITQNFMIDENCGWKAEPCCDEGEGYYSCYDPWECDVSALACG
jgi:uncharacterized protein YkwD